MSERSYPASDSSSNTSKTSIHIPKKVEKIKAKGRPARRYSTGNSTVIPSEPTPLPNYLRASIGSCHDFCKYGIKKSPLPYPKQGEKSDIPPPEIKKSPLPSPKNCKNSDIRGKTIGESSNSSSTQRPKLKQGNRKTSLKSSSTVRINGNETKTDTKTLKKNDDLPSSGKDSTPTKTREIKKSVKNIIPEKIILSKINKKIDLLPSSPTKTGGIKKSVENISKKMDILAGKDSSPTKKMYENVIIPEKMDVFLGSCGEVSSQSSTIREIKKMYESVIIPEKIIHVVEVKEGIGKEDILVSKQSNEVESVAETRIGGHIRRSVSEGDFIDEKIRKEYMKHVVRRGMVDERNRMMANNPNLMNNMIGEEATKLVKERKSKVKALVGAFENVIKIQDCGSPKPT